MTLRKPRRSFVVTRRSASSYVVSTVWLSNGAGSVTFFSRLRASYSNARPVVVRALVRLLALVHAVPEERSGVAEGVRLA